MNKITYLDGMRLHSALVAGINNVILNQEYLIKINVFPVPDGDTGTNMAFTLTSIIDSTQKKIYHPVLKRYRDHLGTDFAAPRGTPIMSVADGIIKEVRWGKNNGRFVKISHNNIYSTQYLHMSKFNNGIKNGKKVLQGEVIVYFGSEYEF